MHLADKFQFDATIMVEFLDIILRDLPENSRLAKEVEQATTVWLLVISAALEKIFQEETEVLQNFQQARQQWFDSVQGVQTEFDSFRNNISLQKDNVLLQTVSTEKKTIAKQAEPLVAKTIPEPSQAFIRQEPPSKKSPAAVHHNADSLRNFCWKMATCSDMKQLQALLSQKPGNQPIAQPREQDIVLHGLPEKFAEFGQIWVGPAKSLPLFMHHWPSLGEDAHMWLSFSTTFQNNFVKIPRWLQTHQDALPLWLRWHDLLFWAIMAPDATVFVNNIRARLCEQRKMICMKLFELHSDFEKALENAEESLIGGHLHKTYSTFYQFLFPEDLDINSRHKHVFTNLRSEVRGNIDIWRKYLQITEESDCQAGALRAEEFLGNVRKHTERNVKLPVHDSFFKGIPVRESQVVYWLRPKWKLLNPPQYQNSDLLGSVLYSFD